MVTLLINNPCGSMAEQRGGKLVPDDTAPDPEGSGSERQPWEIIIHGRDVQRLFRTHAQP